jgi:hypothetical protein
VGGGLAKVPPYLIGYRNGLDTLFLFTTNYNGSIRDRNDNLMGARTNYTIVTTDNPAQNINVYAHWDGESSVFNLKHALQKAMPRIKMGDTSYAVRILIDNLTMDGRDSETGYGIYIGEDITHEEQYEYKEVNLLKGTVCVGQMVFPISDFVEVLTG